MIKFMKSWCEGIIVAIVISIIIEMLVPEGNNKKYVKVIVGIYIVFIVLNPIISKIDKDFKIENVLEFQNTVEASSTISINIKEVYVQGIENSIKNEVLENLGYVIDDIKIKVDSNYENIEEIQFRILEKENEIEVIEPIVIERNTYGKKVNEKTLEIKKYISKNFFIDDERIIILN